MIEVGQEPMPVQSRLTPSRAAVTFFQTLPCIDPGSIEDQQVVGFRFQQAADSDWSRRMLDDPTMWLHRSLLDCGVDITGYTVTPCRVFGPGTRGPHRFVGEGHVNHAKRTAIFTMDRLTAN